MGERRSSGVSAPHSTYPDEPRLVVEVAVTEVKEGCALGVVLEHSDEDGVVIAAESLSTYAAPRVNRIISTVKGCRIRIKWVMGGLKPSCTFSVITESTPPLLHPASDDPSMNTSAIVDLTTLQGLREFLGSLSQQAQAGVRRGPPPLQPIEVLDT